MASYYFIVNPTAARGKSARVGAMVKEICKDRNIDSQLVFTDKAGDATNLAAAARDQFECIVAVGGDGTINEIVNGLVGGSSKLGIIPVGSGNDFVRALGIPQKLTSAIDMLMEMKTRSICPVLGL